MTYDNMLPNMLIVQWYQQIYFLSCLVLCSQLFKKLPLASVWPKVITFNVHYFNRFYIYLILSNQHEGKICLIN